MKRFVLSLLFVGLACFSVFGVDSVVVFSEIQYHPVTNEAANEWIELHNQMAIDIDLSAWSLTGNAEFKFAEGTIIPGGGYLVIASDPAALKSGAGITNVLGPFVGRLNNANGNIRLRDRNNRLMDEIDYRDGGKWPVAPDGSGATLAKRDRNSRSGLPENWTSSVVTGGTPGRANFPEPSSVQRLSLIALNSLWRFNASGSNLGTAWREPSFDDSSWAGRNNATLVSYWTFDDTIVATRGENGQFVGTVSGAPDRNGTVGGALAFNGALSQYVQVPMGGGLNGASAGTISLWVKWTGTQDADCCGTFGAVLARQANGQFSDDIIALNGSDPTTARVVWRQSGGPAPILITGTTPVGNTWHHLAVTFSSTSGSTLYLDGLAQGSATGNSLNNNSSTVLSIGAWAGDGAGFSTASIDDVAIWDQPLTAAQIAQLAAQTRAPLAFGSPESAVYFAGDGRLTSNDDLRRTMLPVGPTTYYFRTTFPFANEPSRAELKMDLAVDDGAVLYLNGIEIFRQNMPAGPVSYSTLASSAVGDASIMTGIPLPASALIRGTNVLAVEVHQAAAADSGMIFGAGLGATITAAAVFENRTLVTWQDSWKLDASNTDFGAAWRDSVFNDSAWSNATAFFYAGNAQIDGLSTEQITGVVASASSEYLPDGRLAAHTVDGTGLSGNAHVISPAGTMWLNNGTLATPNDLNPFITFDLGSVQSVRAMKVWNYNEDLPGRPELLARGVSRGDVLLAQTAGAFTSFIPGQLFNKAPGTVTDFSQTIDFGGVSTRYVKLDKLTNFPGGDFRFVGLSEVQFFRDPSLKQTELPLGPVTYYFRKTFNFVGNPVGAQLMLNAVVDDGAVFYLNGAEIFRTNLAAGTVNHSTLANTLVGHAAFMGPVSVSAASLVRGTNTLAVEVHQFASTGDPDMIFGAELTVRIPPAGTESVDPGGLFFNEISAASAVPFQLELINRSAQPVDVGGYIVQRTGLSPNAESVLSAQTLAPGAFLVLNQTSLGFGALSGDKLFLVRPGRGVIADAVEVHDRARARSPDGTGEWLTPNAITLGNSNGVSLHGEIVINEIMYHAPPTLEIPAVTGPATFITFTNLWRYEQSGTDLGTAWRLREYDDSAWPSGPGALYVTSNSLPVAKSTLLTLGPTTYYFRATFVYTGGPVALPLNLRHVVDDGAVIYLNGAEVHRFNLPATGPISYATNASFPIANPAVRSFTISASNLVSGVNVLAAEVHQATNNGGDIVFAAELSGTVDLVPRTPFSDSPEQWVELFNRSSNAVNLTGWRLDEAVDFRFLANTAILPGGYLVVAQDPATLLSRFPGINVTGPFTNRLSHHGGRIVLKDAADNPANTVQFFDDGRWPDAADGRGASLELRDPRADNSAGEAWAASNESARSQWRTYSYRGIAAASPVGPDGQWREFVMGLLAAGEILLDDISVIDSPSTTAVQLIQNGTFDTGTNKWRIIGNHHGEVIDDPDQPGNKVLHLTATGSTEHMSNHGETTFVNNTDIVNGREYQISFRAKWLRGSRQFHTRLYFNRLPRTTLLEAPALHGTPGTRNSTFATNIGPTYDNLRHDPVVPAPFAPVTVSIQANDPDGVGALNLWWRADGSAWSSLPMAADVAMPSTFSASLPGKAAGTVVQFYVEGIDGRGLKSSYPADGTNARALYQVDNGLAATNGLHNVRLITLAAETAQLFRTVNLMSNERIGCTMIYDEREVFYDIGLRLKGSEHSRTTTPRLGFNLGLTSAQSFRGVHHSLALDRSESTGYGQREMINHQTLNHAGGLPTKYHDLVQVIAPRPEYTGAAELQLARYTDVFLDDQFDHGSDGTVFEYELVYQLNPPTDNGTPEGNKVPAPDSVVGTTIRNLGDDKEGYRWNFLIKNNEDKDDYSRIMTFCKTMEMTGANFISQITNLIEIDQWLRGVAVNDIVGVGDSYGGDGSQHNVQFYVRPTDRRVIYFPHDLDAFFDPNRSIVPNNDLSKLLTVPAFARAYYCHLLDIIATTYNGTYMTRWANHFGRLLPAQSFASHLAFVVQRANTVTSQVNAAVPNVAFAITSNGGNNFETSSNLLALTGTAPLSVKTIEVNGVSYPITWTSTTAWSLLVPLFNGTNFLTVQGVNRSGQRLTNISDTITITNNGPGALLPVVINEWMAGNAAPFGYADPEDGSFQDWFELFNPNASGVNLSGYYLTDNLGQPTKWQVPPGAVVSPHGFMLVWADNQPEQNAVSTNGHLHAGFQLSSSGEALGLYSPVGVAQHVVVFGPQIQNVSQGLFPDGNTNTVYFMTNFTPNAANTLAGPLRLNGLTWNAGLVTLSWSAVPGRHYRVHYKDNLDEPVWIPLGEEILASANNATASDALALSSHRFYRVIRTD